MELPDIIPATAITVVVACRNEASTVSALLRSLAAQDYPAGLLEVIVVNDNSTDRTPVVVSEFITNNLKPSLIKIRLINNPFTGKKSAIRHGIEKSSGELILTTDADCTVGPGWVSAYAGFYARTGSDMILARVNQPRGRGFVSRFGALEFAALQGVTEATARSGFPVMCNGANMGIRRETYLRHAGQLHEDIPSGDDMFLLHSVKHEGGDVGYLADAAAAVNTATAVSAAALLRQRARWASKAGRYRDPATLALAAATAACHAAVTAAATASLFSSHYLPLLALLSLLHLIPDYLLTRHAMNKKEEHLPLPLFIIMDFLYPFWFITVGLLSFFPRMREFRKR
ncbi:MAG TPA: glycosyltransferase [Bacteroidales bacterium]|nr:glycosyltransferase [Bacteroidales bacterium]